MLIFLIELGDAHDECLYSQIRFLREINAEVHLICNSSLRNKIDLQAYVNQITFIESPKSWSSVLKLYNLIQRESPDQLIFNTLEGNSVKKLLTLLALKNLKISGTLHDVGKLRSSISFRWLIPKLVPRIFVLNDYILDRLKNFKRSKIESYYPIFYAPYNKIEIPKGEDEIWITVPGVVAQKRRDYIGLLKGLKKTKLQSNVRIILLGPCLPEMYDLLNKEVEEIGLKGKVIYWKDAVEHDLFYSYIEKSDYLLPLLHPDSKLFEKYISEKISGTFNLSFGFRKPLLIEQSFKVIDDFQVNSISYEVGSLVGMINLLKGSFEYQEMDKFSFESQSRKYLRHIS